MKVLSTKLVNKLIKESYQDQPYYNEEPITWWYGHYIDMEGNKHLLRFILNSEDYEEAEAYFDEVIPQPYVSMKLHGHVKDNDRYLFNKISNEYKQSVIS